MTYEEVIRNLQMSGMTQQTQVEIPLEKIDLFISRCISELGYNEHSLHQTISFKLYGQVQPPSAIILSDAEAIVLPRVLARLEGKL